MSDQIQWPAEPRFFAQRAADLKAGEFYEGREVAHVSPIGGGIVVIRFADGTALKVMGDQPLTDDARLEDAVAAFDLAYRQARFLHRVGVMDWPAAMDESKLAIAMLERTASNDAEARAAILVVETMTAGLAELAKGFAAEAGLTLPDRDLLDEHDRDHDADEADHAETFRR